MTLHKRLAPLNETDRRFALSRIAELNERHTFHPKQIEVKQSLFGPNGRSQVFCRKGRKAGGTEIMLYPAFLIAGAFRNSLCILIYPDAPTANKILNSTNRIKQFAPPGWGCRVNWSKEGKTIYFPQTNSRIEVYGAHQWETMQGFEFDFCAFDEIADHDPRAWKTCYPNIIARPNAQIMIVGAPALDRSNHYYKIEKEAKAFPETWAWHKWTARDNPYVDFDIEAAKKRYYFSGDGDFWEIQFEANDVIGGASSVLKKFDQNIHVVPDSAFEEAIKDRDSKIFVSTDPGYAKSFANVIALYHPKQRTLHIVREVVEKDRNKISIGGKGGIWEKIQDRLKAIPTPEPVKPQYVYDAAALGFRSEIVNNIDRTVNMFPCKKQDGDEDRYFRQWNSLLAHNRFFLHHSCVETVIEIQNYITDENGKYPDKNNHCLDAIRYLIKAVGMQHPDFERLDDIDQLQFSIQTVDPDAGWAYKGKEADNSNPDDWPFL